MYIYIFEYHMTNRDLSMDISPPQPRGVPPQPRGTPHPISHKDKKRLKVKQICPNADYCLSYGIKSDEIRDIFGDYTDLSQVVEVKTIGAQSANGFIKKFIFQKMISPGHLYESSAIFKSVQNHPGVDNLYYEYFVGIFINYLCVLFPIFVRTYGMFTYNDDNAYMEMQKLTMTTKNAQSGNWLKNNLSLVHGKTVIKQPQQSEIRYACSKRERFALLTEYETHAVSLDSLLTDIHFVQYDLYPLCYVIYGILNTIRDNFTHYDLHTGNVLLIPCADPNGIFQYTLHLYEGTKQTEIINLYSRYVPKIIDYGRCYFSFRNNSSQKLYESLCKVDHDCCLGSGFWLNPPNPIVTHYINSSVRNISHDLRLMRIISKKMVATGLANHHMKNINDKIIYATDYGTPENLTPYSQDQMIHNIYDMMSYLKNLHKVDKSNFPTFPDNFTVYGKFDIHLTTASDALSSYIAHDFHDTSIIPVP